MAASLGWAIVGTGTMSRGIAAAVASEPGSRVAAVVSRDPLRAAAFAEGLPEPHPTLHGDLDAALADADVRVVYVGSPNALHVADTRRALTAGRHVLCDKPLATDAADAAALRDLAAARSVVLSVNLQMRHVPFARQVRDWVRDGAVGRPVLARAALAFGHEELEGWRGEPDLAGAAALYNLGIHALDLVVFVLGDRVACVQAMSAPEGAALDRTDVVSLRFASGTLGMVLASQELAGDDVDLEITGTHGVIRWEGWMSPYREGTLTLWQGGAETSRQATSTPDAYARLIADFGRAVRDGTLPEPSADEAVQTVAVVEAARRSGHSRTVVCL